MTFLLLIKYSVDNLVLNFSGDVISRKNELPDSEIHDIPATAQKICRWRTCWAQTSLLFFQQLKIWLRDSHSLFLFGECYIHLFLMKWHAIISHNLSPQQKKWNRLIEKKKRNHAANWLIRVKVFVLIVSDADAPYIAILSWILLLLNCGWGGQNHRKTSFREWSVTDDFIPRSCL